MSFVVELSYETEQEFLAETDGKSQDVLKELILEYLDKRKRQKHREELLKNISPEIKKWSGIIKETDIKKIHDERFHDLIARD